LLIFWMAQTSAALGGPEASPGTSFDYLAIYIIYIYICPF
jgi:hypothetical protein